MEGDLPSPGKKYQCFTNQTWGFEVVNEDLKFNCRIKSCILKRKTTNTGQKQKQDITIEIKAVSSFLEKQLNPIFLDHDNKVLVKFKI